MWSGSTIRGSDGRSKRSGLNIDFLLLRYTAGIPKRNNGTEEMRRVLSISLLLVMSLALVAPLLASIPESSLPMCCRRNGAHHCMGTAGIAADGTLVTLEGPPCPMAPKAIPAAQSGPLWLAGSIQDGFSAVAAHPNGRPQTEARYRIAFGRCRQKRGPPSYLL
jgi:hypothetical protein